MALKIIAGQFKGRRLKSLKKIRPTKSIVKEALFNLCREKIQGAFFLDLFAGSGAVGLEALSRGAKHVTFIERDREAIKIVNENIANLHVESYSTVILFDVFLALQKKKLGSFDIVYIDPPYEKYSDVFIKKILFELKKFLNQKAAIFIESPFKEREIKQAGFVLIDTKKFGHTILNYLNFL